MAEPLLTPIQHILELTQAHITFLEAQMQQVEGWIADQVQTRRPEVAGLVLAAGITAEIGDLQRFFHTPKWDKHHKRYRPRTQREVEDAVAKLAGLWWPRSESGDFAAEDRHLAITGNRYLRYYFVQAANGMRPHIPAYTRFYALKFREATHHKHKRALVLSARKSVGLFVALLHRKEAFRSKVVGS